jgi:hypothetical protein
MGHFLKMIVFIGALWAIDAITFGGRYSAAVWEEATDQGQQVRYQVDLLVSKVVGH